MKLKEIMTKPVVTVQIDDTLQTAAQKMRDADIGFLPVLDGNQVVGVLTDRDIIMRAIAAGVDPKTMLGRDLATSPAICCLDDQDVEEAARLMHDNQIRRILILHQKDRGLAGVISLSDLALNADGKLTGRVLQSISEPV